ncbi:MAG: hypothetical protein JEZ09_12410 [Salinivirgaceae bacterium]|nr:hypothetical protein [Salinivirgaceae bacterium]
MYQIYPYFIKFHVIFSVVFLATAIGITIHSLIGWLKKKEYGSFDNRFSKIFLVLLYIDLLLGVILYFFLQKPAELISAAEAMRYSNLRFWAIQHFSNMMFVVILCIIGNLFIKRTAISDKKFKYSFIYFGISTLIIVVSVGLFALRK